MSAWAKVCNFGDCLEHLVTETVVFLRSSRKRDDVIGLTPEEWRRHIADAKAGKYDEPDLLERLLRSVSPRDQADRVALVAHDSLCSCTRGPVCDRENGYVVARALHAAGLLVTR